MKYSGTGTFSQPVCYELILQQLTIPNVILNNSTSTSSGNIGGRLNKYPFVYVNFYSETSRSTDQSIYSNNQNIGIAPEVTVKPVGKGQPPPASLKMPTCRIS
jgi:hypothetical protein